MGDRDSECIGHCLDGRPEEYRFLVERYQRPLVSWLTGRLGNRTLAEEAAQEAFVRAWFALARFRTGEAFFPWLSGIALQVAQEMWRADRRRDRHRQSAVATAMGSADAGANGIKEPDLRLRQAVDALPGAHRDVVLLRYYGQCSCKEVAERLGLPLGTVTKMLSRAHAQLRELLGQRGENPGQAD